MSLLTSLLSPLSIAGSVNYKGTWDADTNTPTLTSGIGTQGDYYVVSVAGTTTLDGISSWDVGDWAIFNGTAWEKVDNSEIWVDDGTTISPANANRNLEIDGQAEFGASTDGVIEISDSTDTIKIKLNSISDSYITSGNLGIGTATPNTYLDVQGGQTVEVTTVNAATYDLLITDYILHVTYTTTGAVTSLTLPTAQTVSGRVIIVKDAGLNAATNTITVDTEGSETIDGNATDVINGDGDWRMYYSDGSNWFIIS